MCEAGTFLACVATRETSADYAALAAATLLAESDWEGALKLLDGVADSACREVKLEALLMTGELSLGAGNADTAVPALLEASRLAPDNPCALGYLSELALLSEDSAHALDLAFRALELDPAHARACAAMARVVEGMAHPDTLSAWRIAARLAPDDPEIVTSYARVAAQHNDYAAAITCFEQLRSYEDSTSPAFHTTLAWLLLSDGRVADACVEAKIATALAPEDATVHELWHALREAGAPLGRG
jgi:tetratricopeptide (TPR) repeat protein